MVKTVRRFGRVSCIVVLLALLTTTSSAAAAGFHSVIPAWFPQPTGAANTPKSDAHIVTGSGGGTGVQPFSLTNGSWLFQCNGNVPVQAWVNRLVTGNCNNIQLYSTQVGTDTGTPAPQSPNFWGGYIAGGYNGCGWINSNNVIYQNAPDPYPTVCVSPRLWKPDYVYCNTGPETCPHDDSGTNLAIWTSSSGNDGVTVNITHTCAEYANYRPWMSANAPVEPNGATIYAGRTTVLRYLSKFQSADATHPGYYAMIHDGPRWAFVSWGCLT